MRISIDQLNKQFGSTPVLRDVCLEVASKELFFLLGPSGCGKTTLLRTLAGFYEPDSGMVRFGERSMNGVPPHDRNIGMVFQNYALWPHMNVAQNVAYGLEVRKCPREDRDRRVSEALATVRMEAFADRSPNQLSGGQQQRVALARALVVKPDLLLLDEPLSNLDARLRLEMRDEIRRIHQETRITTIYVTHDQKEALSLADRMGVMREGRVEQLDAPRTVYRHPANRFVADFIGETNWLEGRVTGLDAAGCRVETSCGTFEVPATPGRAAIAAGAGVWLGFRPEGASLRSDAPGGLAARVVQTTYLGETEQYQLALDSGVEIKVLEANPRGLRAAGERVSVHVAPEAWICLPRQA